MRTFINCYSPLAWTTALALGGLAFVVPVRAQAIATDAAIKAQSNCLASVAKTVGLPSSRLRVIQHTINASGISVDVKVPKATAPWACLTNRQGKVQDVHFKGSEGAL